MSEILPTLLIAFRESFLFNKIIKSFSYFQLFLIPRALGLFFLFMLFFYASIYGLRVSLNNYKKDNRNIA